MFSSFVHFETLRARVASHPNTPVFKLPKAGALGREWVDVSYTQFQADIERMAKVWSTKLSTHTPRRSVVGIWCVFFSSEAILAHGCVMSRLRGYTYADVITIYAISRAGFIPQMFGFELPNTRIVFELLSKYDGKAIVHDPAKTAPLLASKTSLPCHIAIDYLSVADTDVVDMELPELPEAKPEDFTFIYHSSGSVSGIPKVVPTTNKWLSTIEKKSGPAFCIGDFETQDVYIWTYVNQSRHPLSFHNSAFTASPSLIPWRYAVCPLSLLRSCDADNICSPSAHPTPRRLSRPAH